MCKMGLNKNFGRSEPFSLTKGNLEEDEFREGDRKEDSWSISRNFIYRHHDAPGTKLYIPHNETFPIPLTYVDVTRQTQTSINNAFENTMKRSIVPSEGSQSL